MAVSDRAGTRVLRLHGRSVCAAEGSRGAPLFSREPSNLGYSTHLVVVWGRQDTYGLLPREPMRRPASKTSADLHGVAARGEGLRRSVPCGHLANSGGTCHRRVLGTTSMTCGI